jgi:hypothetical protein
MNKILMKKSTLVDFAIQFDEVLLRLFEKKNMKLIMILYTKFKSDNYFVSRITI